MMTDARVMSIDELKAFLCSSDVLTFKGNSREETYGWIERILRSYKYLSRPRLRAVAPIHAEMVASRFCVDSSGLIYAPGMRDKDLYAQILGITPLRYGTHQVD